MNDEFALSLKNTQMRQAAEELRECNEITLRYGLALTEQQIKSLVERRFAALKDTGRVEFGPGILKLLITTFCNSPYLTRDNYEETLIELQDSFYYFKNEARDLISDEELITFMKEHFDGICQGSLEHLSGTTLEELCRNTRYGHTVEEAMDMSDHLRRIYGYKR